jgi:hypothetical protein
MPFQKDVDKWVVACFGTTTTRERCYRFLEESLELVQSLGTTKEEALTILNYVYSRPNGIPHRELGGTVTTLAALSNKIEEDMMMAGYNELQRNWQRIDEIRNKDLMHKSEMRITDHDGNSTS